jgi:hypothetical protein
MVAAAACPSQILQAKVFAVARGIIDIPNWIDNHSAAVVFCLDDYMYRITIGAGENLHHSRIYSKLAQHC